MILGWIFGGLAFLGASALASAPPGTVQEAVLFAAGGAVIGMFIAAKIGSKRTFDALEGVEPIWAERKEAATRAGTAWAALGSIVGAILGAGAWLIFG